MLTPALRPPTDKAEVIALSSPCPGPDEQRARTQGAPLAAAASAYVVTLVPPGIPWALVQTSAAVGNGRSPTSALGQKRRLDHCPVTSGVPQLQTSRCTTLTVAMGQEQTPTSSAKSMLCLVGY
jgi:hypothetical protein